MAGVKGRLATNDYLLKRAAVCLRSRGYSAISCTHTHTQTFHQYHASFYCPLDMSSELIFDVKQYKKILSNKTHNWLKSFMASNLISVICVILILINLDQLSNLSVFLLIVEN